MSDTPQPNDASPPGIRDSGPLIDGVALVSPSTGPIDAYGGSIFFTPQSRAVFSAQMGLTRTVGTLASAPLSVDAVTQSQVSHSNNDAAPNSVAATGADDATVAETIAQLRARELELVSLLRSCEQGMQRSLEARVQKLEAAHAARLRDADAEATQLQALVGQRDETIGRLAQDLQRHEEATQERLREQRRQFLEFEGGLHAEMARVLKDKERMRFEAEVARDQLAAMSTLAASAERRAHDAELLWQAEQRAALVERESEVRAALEAAQSETMLVMNAAFEGGAALLGVSERRHAESARALRDAISTVNELSPGSGDTDEALLGALEQQQLARDAEAAHLAAMAQEQHDAAAALADAVQELSERLDGVEAAARAKQQRLQDRVDAAERALAAVSTRVARDSGRRVTARATDAVLSELVAQHDDEVRALSTAKAELHEQLLLARRTNCIDEAADLRRKVGAATLELEALRLEHRKAVARYEAVASEARTAEKSATESFTALKAKIDEVEALKAQRAREAEEHQRSSRQLEASMAEALSARAEAERGLAAAIAECAAAQKEAQQQRRAAAALQEQLVQIRVAETAARLARAEQEPAASDPHRMTATSSDTSDAHEVNALREKVLLLKRDRDALRRQLDAANAEAAAAEERRATSMGRYLALLSANDAAPRREQSLQSQLFELQQQRKRLEASEAQVEQRRAEVERREATVQRQIAAYQARGVNLLLGTSVDGGVVGTARKSLNSARSGLGGSEVDAATSVSKSPSAGALPAALLLPVGSFGSKLAPIAHRPAALPPPPSQPHPQRPPQSSIPL